uniref:Metalloendopeptidase n=1 Tax=Angiostrongylus cantonensis TaxID=6313 RepID=A0A158P7N1_ANGCA
MVIILLFAVLAIVTKRDQTCAITEVKTLNVRQDAENTKKKELSKHEKEIPAKPRDYNPNLENPISKRDSEEGRGRFWFKSGTVLTGEKDKAVVRSLRAKRQVLKDKANPTTTWENGVFYTFNTSDQNVKKVFKMGVKVWRDSTCIDFVEDKNATDKVIVVGENECWADIARMGGEQFLSLTWDATVGSAVHEIGHVLGFFHTMCRYDRDSYIKLVTQNINKHAIGNFQKISRNCSDVYGMGYDYGSIMHYDERCTEGLRAVTTLLAKQLLKCFVLLN